MQPDPTIQYGDKPDMPVDLIIRNATTPDSETMVDLAIHQGKIVAKQTNLEMQGRQEILADGNLVIPGFVESHVHLDIALMNNDKIPGRTEPYLTHYGLNDALERRRKLFSTEDIMQRASKAIKLASRHGVTALRAQCHLDPEVGLKHVQALAEVKKSFANLVDLQLVGFPQQGLYNNRAIISLYEEAFKSGLLDVMGCASNLDRSNNFKAHIDQAFEIATTFDVDLDAHVDLGLLDEVSYESLEVVHLAKRTLETGYQGRVTAGHVCTLDSASPDVAKKTINIIHEAQLNVVSQPDLYRLGRNDQQHVRRGLTRVKELLAAGVNVTFASNNVRDALRPLGNFDLLEEGLVLAQGAHMDLIEDLENLIKMCTINAAKALRLPGYGLDVGCQADLVVLDAPSPSAAIINQAEKLYVIKKGHLVAINRVLSESFF